MRKKIYYIIFFWSFFWTNLLASNTDSLKHWGGSIMVNPGQIMLSSRYDDMYETPQKKNLSISAELTYSGLPTDSDAYASDYNYPTISFGVKYSINEQIKFHRKEDYGWEDEVNYDSHIGNSVALYTSFSRALFRTNKWMADLSVKLGTAYSHTKYDKNRNVDNELIGSKWLIFFSAGMHVTYRLASKWGLKGGLEYWHLSNGAFNRPNRGANFIGPSVGVCYYPYYESVVDRKKTKIKENINSYWWLNFSLGLGAKTLEEDWNMTQYELSPDDPDYKTNHFKLYMAYSAQVDIMHRYARRWASGLGLDVNYGQYSSRLEERDKQNGYADKHSPWSVGISAKHQAYFHNLSMHISLGTYLYREMGHRAKSVEKPYYETIGLKYEWPALRGAALGFKVKAHFLKADFTEMFLSFPIKL